MKKVFFFWMILLSFASCSQIDVSNVSKNPKSTIEVSNKRSVAEAMDIALQALGDNEYISTRGKSNSFILSATPIIVSKTRSVSDTVLYAIDYKDNLGFALISTDRRIEPLLAVIEEGSFNSNETTNNEGFQFALRMATNYAANPENYKLVPDTNAQISKWYAYSDTIFPHAKEKPRVKMLLSQFWPEGMFCPNKIAGCTQVAAINIMSVLNMPSAINYTYTGHDINKENLNWNLLNNHRTSFILPNETNMDIVSHLNSCNLDRNGHSTIGRIAREIGHRANAIYSNFSTSAIDQNVINVICELTSKSPDAQGTDVNGLYYKLAHGWNSVAYVRANSANEENSESSIGHAWVADAIWETGMKINYYHNGHANELGGIEYEVTTVDTMKQYIHYNWGWGGNCNGFFLTNIFNPNEAYEYDNMYLLNSTSNIYSDNLLRYYYYKP